MTTHPPPPGSALALSQAAEDGVHNAVAKAARAAGLPDVRWCLGAFDNSWRGGGHGWHIHGCPRDRDGQSLTGQRAREAVEAYALSFGTEVTEEDGRVETIAQPENRVQVSVWAFTDEDQWRRSCDERNDRVSELFREALGATGKEPPA